MIRQCLPFRTHSPPPTSPKCAMSTHCYHTPQFRSFHQFNAPKFANLPVRSNPVPLSTQSSLSNRSLPTRTRPHISRSKSSSSLSTSKSSNTGSKANGKRKFKAIVPKITKGLPKRKSNDRSKKSDEADSDRSKAKKRGFKPPAIVDREKAAANLRNFMDDFAAAYDRGLGCLGMRRERAKLPKHDPDEPNAVVLWRPEELTESEESGDSDDDENENEQKASQRQSQGKEDGDRDIETEKGTVVKAKKLTNALAIATKAANKKKGKKVKVAIVVDPRLGSKLRPHQVVGVEFVYRCMMESKYAANNEYGEGCILADGMGLGKTLQAIAVMWTLMEQDVFAGEQTCTNGIVLCPASLVENWKNEIYQWLGEKRNTMKPFPCLQKTKETIKKWLQCMRSTNAKHSKPVLIISYESFRAYHELICYKGTPRKCNGKIVDDERSEKSKNEIGFVVCDEGHKLKNYKSQLSVAVSRIKSKKRLLLSGTPIQNDLKEMYSLVNFVNPGVWESVKDFSSSACRIVRSFDSTASDKANTAGSEALESTRAILNKFLLQRTSKVVMAYLPKKSEYVVFCKLTQIQELIYETFLKSKEVREAKKSAANSESGGMNAMGFLACGVLGKICNHPALIYEACARIEGKTVDKRKWKLVSAASKGGAVTAPTRKSKRKKAASHCTASEYASDGTRKRTELKGLYKLYPDDFLSTYSDPAHSSKMNFTINLLLGLKGQRTGDKTVIVSVYTETLDILAIILEKVGIEYLRLDGSIPTKKRQPIVDDFNSPSTPYLVLLLSNRAGGCGLNLIGANRLIMYDADWNPANDAQAMARVWRSGQKKETYIYRLFSTGTLEEKVFQRQTFKSDLAEQLVAAKEDLSDITEFAVKELKRIFMYNKHTECDTLERTKNKGYTQWNKHPQCINVGDPFLTRAAKFGKVSYLFSRIVNDPKLREKEEQKEEEEEDQNDENMKEEMDQSDEGGSDKENETSNAKTVSKSSVTLNKPKSSKPSVGKKKGKKRVIKTVKKQSKKRNSNVGKVQKTKKGAMMNLCSDSDDEEDYENYSQSDGEFDPNAHDDDDNESESDY